MPDCAKGVFFDGAFYERTRKESEDPTCDCSTIFLDTDTYASSIDFSLDFHRDAGCTG